MFEFLFDYIMYGVGSLYQVGWYGSYYLAVKSLDGGESLLFSSIGNLFRGGPSDISERVLESILMFNRTDSDLFVVNDKFRKSNLVSVGGVKVDSRTGLCNRVTDFVSVSDESREVLEGHLKGEPVLVVLPENFSAHYDL